MVTTKVISIDKISDIMEFNAQAHKVEGDVVVRRGIYVVDAKSLLGVISLNPAEGITVEFPEEATDFATYLNDKYGQL